MTTNSYTDAFADMTGGRRRRGRKPGPKKGSRRSRSRSASYDSYSSSDSSSGGSVNTLLSDLLSGKSSGKLRHGTKYTADILPKLPGGLGLNPLANILSTGSSIAGLSTGTNLASLFSNAGLGMPTNNSALNTINGPGTHPALLQNQRNAELQATPQFNAAVAGPSSPGSVAPHMPPEFPY